MCPLVNLPMLLRLLGGVRRRAKVRGNHQRVVGEENWVDIRRFLVPYTITIGAVIGGVTYLSSSRTEEELKESLVVGGMIPATFLPLVSLWFVPSFIVFWGMVYYLYPYDPSVPRVEYDQVYVGGKAVWMLVPKRTDGVPK